MLSSEKKKKKKKTWLIGAKVFISADASCRKKKE